MGSKPVVCLALPRETYERMFRREDLDRLSEAAEIRGPFDNSERPNLIRALSGATVAITGWGSQKFDREMLEAADSLRLIAHSAGSVKSIVDEAVYDRGIRVTTSASANAVPVAQFTVAMMVIMLKQVPWLAEQYRRNAPRSEMDRLNHVRELQDIDVGLVGASRIGRLVVQQLKQFSRIRIRMYDPYLSQSQAAELGVQLCSLEEVFRCPVVSIHAPKTPQTHHMVNARLLSLLPDHAVLINTSRGSLIDEDALIAEVRKRPIYVALDVTDPEPPAPDSPLRSEPNIILTPHIAGAMKQACLEMGQLAIDQTLRFLSGKSLQHEVTRAMLPTQA